MVAAKEPKAATASHSGMNVDYHAIELSQLSDTFLADPGLATALLPVIHKQEEHQVSKGQSVYVHTTVI